MHLPSKNLSPFLPSASNHRIVINNNNNNNNSSSNNNKRTQNDVIASRTPFSPNSSNWSATPSPSSPSFNLPPSSSPLPLPIPSKLSHFPSHSRPSSPAFPVAEDVLAPGDFVGEGGFLQGDHIRLVSRSIDVIHPASEFHVIRRLGTGSYAVVYHVREVLYRPPPSEDGHSSLVGPIELDDLSTPPGIQYGNDYALKCLSKANLDEDALAAQMSEVTIHQSLRPHPNIVTLHRTLETSSFLLLLLEYVPGEDLFYFLEQARDHYDADPPSPDTSLSSSRTPPTPTLLSTLNPAQLLSRTRLRLISSMFAQMCDAVAACHAQQVFHRDIKPENFIVTDGWSTTPSGSQERKVVVKLTDFGLSTSDIESSDMDCGSAPYMSYECRNNTAPSYRPRGADVWSLGIVLINMLYHCNPWTDTTQCPSFELYLQQPANFFMNRFAGMTVPVAEHLANNVFCILEDHKDDSPRMSASDFGAWAKDLPALLGVSSGPKQHKRVISTSSTQGHPISPAILQSHRPCSRQASVAPAVHSRSASRSVSRAPSRGPAAFEHEVSELSTVYDQELDEQDEQAQPEAVGAEAEAEGMDSRSTSTNKRRKRGARRGKGVLTSQDDTLASLADASQSLAREISKASQATTAVATPATAASQPSTKRPPPALREPTCLFPIPTALLTPPLPPKSPVVPTTRTSSNAKQRPSVVKKPSKWKLSFGKSSGERALPVEEAPLPIPKPAAPSPPAVAPTATAISIPDSSSSRSSSSNATMSAAVTNLIMGLNAPPLPSGVSAEKSESAWGRGRSRKSSLAASQFSGSSARARSLTSGSQVSLEPSAHRPVSPGSTRYGRPVASSAISIASSSNNSNNNNGNWRSSMMSTASSAGNSSSAFTRFSNSSVHSFSTTATSLSGSSWRTGSKPQSPLPSSSSSLLSSSSSSSSQVPPVPAIPPGVVVPRNIKLMAGVPWELSELPRQQHQNPVGDIFGPAPPARKQRVRNKQPGKDGGSVAAGGTVANVNVVTAGAALDTITERPVSGSQKSRVSVVSQWHDASTSTTDLVGGFSNNNHGGGGGGGGYGSNSGKEDGAGAGGDSPKKVQKGQIHALAKMLSALRR